MKSACRFLYSILCAAICFTFNSVQAAEPVAMITDLTGTAWLQKNGKQEKLNILSYLEHNSLISLDGNSSIFITTFSPAAVNLLSGPAKFKIVDGDISVIEGGKLVKTNLSNQKAQAGRLFSGIQKERIVMAGIVMRGVGLRLVSPVDAELLSLSPTLTWAAPEEMKRFILTLTDETEKKIYFQKIVEASIFSLRENKLLLQRRHQYSWEISSTFSSGEKSAASAKFSILGEQRSKKILQQKPAKNASFSDRVLYATLLENEGLELDAAEEWKVLSEERPNDELLSARWKQ